jgi:hypothetical protein
MVRVAAAAAVARGVRASGAMLRVGELAAYAALDLDLFARGDVGVALALVVAHGVAGARTGSRVDAQPVLAAASEGDADVGALVAVALAQALGAAGSSQLVTMVARA